MWREINRVLIAAEAEFTFETFVFTLRHGQDTEFLYFSPFLHVSNSQIAISKPTASDQAFLFRGKARVGPEKLY